MTLKELKAELSKFDNDLYGDEEVVFYGSHKVVDGIDRVNGAVINTTGDYDIERIVLFYKWADSISFDDITEWRRD